MSARAQKALMIVSTVLACIIVPASLLAVVLVLVG